MREYFLQERNRVKRFRELTDEEKQAGIQGQWQLESPAREYLEHVKCCHDTDCNEPMMNKGFSALKNGTWEEYKETFRKKMKATEWVCNMTKEAFELVAQSEAENMGIVQEIMLRSTYYLRRIVAPVGGQGGVTMSCLYPQCNSFPWKATFGGSQGEKEAISGGVEKTDWKQANRLLVEQTGDSIDQAKVFKAHAVPQGLCANLFNALKLLAKQQEDGDGLLLNIVKDLGKESRKGLTDGLCEIIRNDNKCALEGGYLSQGRGTCKVRKPKVPEGFQEVTVRESPEELTVRAEEVGTVKGICQ